ncbi:MAG: hypothetical protein VX620_15395 [Pseudomonadota bacterium]|nr:hypothetical protein [Pseudomonadota bacterium]
MGQVTFKQVLETAIKEAANDNLGTSDAANLIVTDLGLAGFAIRRSFDAVNYGLPILVLCDPRKGAPGSFGAQVQSMAPSVDDLHGQKGWLVTWSENGRVKAGWFDDEGRSHKQPDYRVINPKTPCAGAIAAQCSIVNERVA